MRIANPPSTIPSQARASTGIPGLDTILHGGFLRGGVYIVQGRSADVIRVAEETLSIFQSYNTHREAMAALLVFCGTARMNQAGIELVREVSGFLKRVRNNPDLRFSQPS